MELNYFAALNVFMCLCFQGQICSFALYAVSVWQCVFAQQSHRKKCKVKRMYIYSTTSYHNYIYLHKKKNCGC